MQDGVPDNGEYYRGSFRSQNDRPNVNVTIEPSKEHDIIVAEAPLYDEKSIEELKKDFFYEPTD